MFNIREKLKSIVREVIHEEYGITIEPVPEEELTAQDKANIKEALHDLATGNYSGPFSTDEEIQAHFDSLKS